MTLFGKPCACLLKVLATERGDRCSLFPSDIDFIPTEEYSTKDAKQALDDAEWVVELAKKVIG